jgi:hypothetical protein
VDFLAAVRADRRGGEIFPDSDSRVRHAGMWHSEAPTAITAGERGWKRPATATGRDEGIEQLAYIAEWLNRLFK